MKVVLFYHSLISDWNHGNAHFLRGIASELIKQGHELRIYEPADSWSCRHLIEDHGTAPIEEFRARYPLLSSNRYRQIDVAAALKDAQLVIVHEWNAPGLVKEIGKNRPKDCVLLFHDTHHRAATCPETMAGYDLSRYDGVLAYGNALREIYLQRNWTHRAWTWHEAADTSHFKPLPRTNPPGDLVWIGNWGDEERTAELEEFLLEPVQRLGLNACVYGVRYPKEVLKRLEASGITYGGWLPNYHVPRVFAAYKVTIHIPRRPYATLLPGIPTIRPFEALACGIPLVTAPWSDSEGMFTPGKDFLIARNGREMTDHLSSVLNSPGKARILAEHGLETIRDRHTCRHRVNQLLGIYQEITGNHA